MPELICKMSGLTGNMQISNILPPFLKDLFFRQQGFLPCFLMLPADIRPFSASGIAVIGATETEPGAKGSLSINEVAFLEEGTVK
jgi:hypothetical protein